MEGGRLLHASVNGKSNIFIIPDLQARKSAPVRPKFLACPTMHFPRLQNLQPEDPD